MKKFIKYSLMSLALLISFSFMLVGCGSEKLNTKLYRLSISSNIEVDLSEFEVNFAFGERANIHTRPQDDADEYLSAGATQEDIAKTGVRQSDGSYYFFEGDPIHITEVEVPGYVFVGIFYKNTNNKFMVTGLTECQLDDGSKEILPIRDNMPDKDIELEARYVPFEYSITYCYGSDKSSFPKSFEMPEGTHSNPSKFSYLTDKEKDLTLSDPTEVIEGFKFLGWYYTTGSGEKYSITTLPKTQTDYLTLVSSDPATYVPSYNLQLWAEYDIQTYNVNFVVKDVNGNVINGLEKYLNITAKGSNDNNDISIQDGVYSDVVKFGVHVDTGDMYVYYDLVGIYVDDVKLADLEIGGGDTRVNNVLDEFSLTKDIDVEIRVSAHKHDMIFEFCTMPGYEWVYDLTSVCKLITISGDATTVDGVSACPTAITLDNENKGKVVCDYGSTFTLNITTESGYTVSLCELNESAEHVVINENDGVYTITITIETGGWSPEVRIVFSRES